MYSFDFSYKIKLFLKAKLYHPSVTYNGERVKDPKLIDEIVNSCVKKLSEENLSDLVCRKNHLRTVIQSKTTGMQYAKSNFITDIIEFIYPKKQDLDVICFETNWPFHPIESKMYDIIDSFNKVNKKKNKNKLNSLLDKLK